MSNNFKKYILIFLGILSFWLAGVPYLFSKAVPVICENLSYNTHYNVKIVNPRLYLNIIPTAKIRTTSVSIEDKNFDSKFSAENLNIHLRLLPLLSGKIHLNLISADNVEGSFILDTASLQNINIADIIKYSKIKCKNVNISSFKLLFKEKAADKKFLFLGNDFNFLNSSKYLKIKINSSLKTNNTKNAAIKTDLSLPANNNIEAANINFQISDLDLSQLQEYLKPYVPNDIQSLKGIINLDMDKEHLSIKMQDCACIRKDSAKSIIFPIELNINSDLKINGKEITIENSEISSENISAFFSGAISNYMAGTIPDYNINLRINSSKIEDIIQMLPDFKTEDIDAYKLKKYKFFGDVIGNITIKGNNLEPSVNGNIFINNGILTTPIPEAKGATIKLEFKGKYLNYDVIVPAGRNEKVWVKGGVELYNVKYADMRVWSTKNVDLSLAEAKVNPLHEILNFIIGPVPIMNIKGRGDIDITIKGNRKTPHVWGALNLYNVTTYFNEIPDFVLTNADAILNFNDENAVFNLKKGLVNGKNISIDGDCNLAGKFDFDVKTLGQNLDYLYKAVKTSSMINELKEMLPQIDSASSNVNLILKVYGGIKDIEDIRFNENLFIKGSIELLNNTVSALGVQIHETNGTIKFENLNADIDLKTFIGGSPINVNADIKDKVVDAYISAPNLNLKDVVKINDKLQQDISNIIVELNAKYKGLINNIELDKLDFTAKILGVSNDNKLKLSNGSISLKNGKLLIKNISGNFVDTNSQFNINLASDNFVQRPMFSGKILLKDFELSLINLFEDYPFIPTKVRDIIKTVHFDSGKVNVNASINNNNVQASTDIGGIKFTYLPLKLPIKVVNGSLYIRRNFLGLNKINLIADDMPILVDGGIDNIFTKRNFNLYFNSKPKQDFIDKYFNNNRIYPLKLKGDIVYLIRMKGTADNFNLVSEANMEKNSTIYYLGATVGDVENSIILNLNMEVLKKTILNIKEFSYDKLIESQGKRKTRLNMLKASGGINLLPDDLEFKDLRIKTTNPTDARIFNILFRKPNIKQGQFSSDLKFNGRLSNPNILGTFRIVETNIPFLDISMKTLSFIFKDKTIYLSSSGEVLGNDITFKGTLKNKLTPPYYIEQAELYTKILDLNYIIEKLKLAQVNEAGTLDSFATFDIKNTIIKNMKLTANEIRLRNLTAEKVTANAGITDKKEFNLKDFKFGIADGYLRGDFSYNLKDNVIKLKMNAKDINANDIAIALFDLKNQIYGDLTGNVKLSCNGSDFDKCMQTLNGETTFNVKDGRMPKLGSLEYLLKAGNVVKGGITGFSLNGMIDILTPLKTGDFSDIYGAMNISGGVAKNVEISTKGKDLSLFISGVYNFATSEAEMEVLGLLSKKISTMLGPIGNVSLNTLFNALPGIDLSKNSKLLDKINKIPGIELSGHRYRKFISEIKGDINGDNYVTSFKWIN